MYMQVKNNFTTMGLPGEDNRVVVFVGRAIQEYGTVLGQKLSIRFYCPRYQNWSDFRKWLDLLIRIRVRSLESSDHAKLFLSAYCEFLSMHARSYTVFGHLVLFTEGEGSSWLFFVNGMVAEGSQLVGD